MKRMKTMRPFRRRAVLTALGAVVALFAATGVVYADALHQEPNYDWYVGHESAATFTVSNGPQLRGLANLVNGTADLDGDGSPEPAVSFEGKVVEQGSFAITLGSSEFTPIGTPDHPFQGTFIGGGQDRDIRQLCIEQPTASQGPSYIGLFGYCGEHAALKDIHLSDAALPLFQPSHVAISDEGEADVTPVAVIHDVGSIVGYNAGSMENCASRAPVTVTSNRAATDSVPLVVANVGGLAGTSLGDVSQCAYAANLTVTAPSLASNTGDAVVANVGGIAGTQGAVSADGRSSVSGTVSHCSNGRADDSGEFSMGGFQTNIHVVTTGVGGFDRFGVQKEATSASVGGIVGYSYGSILDCVNYGLVNTNSTAARLYKQSSGAIRLVAGDSIDTALAEKLFATGNGGSGVGGIVGTLRDSGMDLGAERRSDVGSSETSIQVRQCFNRGLVAGLARTGGIVGNAGSYAGIDACRNGITDASSGVGASGDGGHVVTTRWNKPMTGGIAGTSSSSISNCSNLAQVENIQTGYYTAGIVGGLDSPSGYTSECHACFNSGQVKVADYATISYREAGIVGNNNGYVHDCVMRSGSVLAHDDGDSTFPNAAIGDDNWGYWSNIQFASSADLKKSSSAAVLNASHAADVLYLEESEWTYWYIAREGYPTLNLWDPPQGRAQLDSTNVSASCPLLADYAGMREAIPELVVTYSYIDGGGAQQEATLIQNVDFYVLPQTGAIAMTGGTADPTPYSASIVGIGNYTGTVSNVCPYGIGPCDLSKCDVSTAPAAYNFDACVYPEYVAVTSPAGVQLDEAEYAFVIYSGDTYNLVSTKKDYVVYDSEGYVSWDGGATRVAVSEPDARARLSGDLRGVDYLLYNAQGQVIYRVQDGAGTTVDPDSGEAVSAPGPYYNKLANSIVNGGGQAGFVVKVTAKAGSGMLKAGSYTTGQYVISPLNLYTDCDIESVTLDVPTSDGSGSNTVTWGWDSQANMLYELDESGQPVCEEDGSLRAASIDFTGGELKPDVSIVYKRQMADGSEEVISVPPDAKKTYRLVYGDPNTTNANLAYVNRDATPVADPGDVAEGASDDEKAANAAAKKRYEALKKHEKAAVVARSVQNLRFSNYVTMFFAINQVSLADDCVVSMTGASADSLPTYAYRDGYGVRPTVRVVRCGNELVEGVDYEVTYANNANKTTPEALAAYAEDNAQVAGLASCTVTGLGNVEGETTFHFAIDEGKSLNELGYTIAPIADQEYNFGYAVQPVGGVKLANADGSLLDLVEGVDYTTSYLSNTVGTAYVFVKGINGYTGALASSFKIVPFDISAHIAADDGRVSGPYTRKGEKAGAEIPAGASWFNYYLWRTYPVLDWQTGATSAEIYGNYGLSSGSLTNVDTGQVYALSPNDPYNPDSNVIMPAPAGSYLMQGTFERSNIHVTGDMSLDVQLVKTSLTQYYDSISHLIDIDAITYDGQPHEPSVIRPSGATVDYADNVEAGVAKYIVTAANDDPYYTGAYVGTFTIEPFDLNDAVISVHNQPYTGQPATPPVTVRSAAGVEYAEGRDFTVTYANNTGKGTATAIVSGVGSCEGEVKAEFKIGQGLDIAQADVAPIADQLYTGAAVEPPVIITYEGTRLTAGTDYTLSYSNNTAVSGRTPAAVAITGRGAYAGTRTTASFNIVSQRDIADALCVAADARYTGSAVTTSVAVSYDGVPLTEGADYEVAFRRNVKAGDGTAVAVIAGVGSYMGTQIVPFSIVVEDGSIERFAEDAASAADCSIAVAEAAHPLGSRGVVLAWQHDYQAQLAAAPFAHALGYELLVTSDQGVDAAVARRVRSSVQGEIVVVAAEVEGAEALAGLVADEFGSERQVRTVAADDAAALSLKLLDELCGQGDGPVVGVANPRDPVGAASLAAYLAANDAPLVFTRDDGTLSGEGLAAVSCFDEALVAGGAFSVDYTLEASLPAGVNLMRLGGVVGKDAAAQVVAYATAHGQSADGAVLVSEPALSGQLGAVMLAAARGVPLAVVGEGSFAAVDVLRQSASPAYGLVAFGPPEAFSDEFVADVRTSMGW